MQDEQNTSFYLRYLAFFGLSWVLAVISILFAKYNPVGWMFISLTHPFNPHENLALSSGGPFVGMLFINFIWPLSLVPLHLISTQIFKWRFWKFLLLWLGFNLLLAFCVQRVDIGL